MILTLTALGLILIPFYEIIFRAFPNVAVISQDTRVQKEMMAVIIALAIGLLALYQGNLKPFKNKWLLFFMGLQILVVRFMPRIPLIINNIDNSGFWVWKPMFEILCFLLMGIAIASLELKKEDIEKLLKIICIIGFLQAAYIILQTLGMDQFFVSKGENLIGKVKFPERVGNLGQPTLVSPFIAMTIPIALYLRKYFFAVTMIIGVFLTHSQIAIGALVIGLCAYLFLMRPKSSIIVAPFGIVSVLILYFKKILIITDNGRFGAWKIVIKDIFNSRIQGYQGTDFSFFGHGLGSFSYLSPTLDNINPKIPSQVFLSAHNDYLEIFYCCGIFGLALAIMALFYTFNKSLSDYKKCSDYRKTMTASLVCSLLIISLCALGTFVWQLGAHIYFTVVIAGLLLNETITGGKPCIRS